VWRPQVQERFWQAEKPKQYRSLATNSLALAFEAWILADAAGLHQRRTFVVAPSFHSFEGSLGLNATKGKDDISRLLGRSYSETSDGPKLFEKVDFAAARKFGSGTGGSRSLDKLLRTLGV
jgi:hypothetical protein